MSDSNDKLPLINGSGLLGAGINLYGPLDGSLLYQIYDMVPGGGRKGFPTSNPKAYFEIPQNARVKDTAGGNASGKAYSTREEYDSHFGASFNAEGSYMGFSASASASFKRDVNNKTSSSFGALTFYSRLYELDLKSTSSAALSADLKQDKDYINLPAKYDRNNPAPFLRFFRKFGTHFVSSVRMGGRLDYSVAVRSSSSFTTEEMEAKLEAEYNGVFAKASASASTEFKTADKKWFDSTQRYVNATGGDNGILASVIPTVNENHHDVFQKWLASVGTGDTAALTMQVRSIDHIFDHDRAPAVRDALRDYSQKYVQLNVSEVTGRLRVVGTEVRPDLFSQPVTVAPRYSGLGRLEVAVLHPETLAVIYANSWTPNIETIGRMPFFAPAHEALERYKGSNYIVVVAMASIISAQSLMLRDGSAFGDFLAANCGAGEGLKNYFSAPQHGSDGAPNSRNNYGLISTFGSTAAGIEHFAEAPKLHSGAVMKFPARVAMYAFLNPDVNGDDKLVYGLSEMGVPPVLVRGAAQPTEEAEAEQESLA